MADLVKIGVPRSAAEQITIHFGNAVPGDEEHEPMPEPAELEAVKLAEPESELD